MMSNFQKLCVIEIHFVLFWLSFAVIVPAVERFEKLIRIGIILYERIIAMKTFAATQKLY